MPLRLWSAVQHGAIPTADYRSFVTRRVKFAGNLDRKRINLGDLLNRTTSTPVGTDSRR